MALAAENFDWEVPVEQRLTKLEVRVDHIQADITELKADNRRINDKLDGLKDGLHQVKESVAGVRYEIVSAKLWAFGLYVTLATGMLATFARSMGWL